MCNFKKMLKLSRSSTIYLFYVIVLKCFAFARSKSVNFFYLSIYILFIFTLLNIHVNLNIFLFSGIEYLCENHQLQMNAKDIAHFLYKGEGLNKTAIGECITNIYSFRSPVFVFAHELENSQFLLVANGN